MSDEIFLLSDGELVPMRERPHEKEDHLQKILATHPHLMSGESFAGTDPSRWLLIRRETPLPGKEGGGAQFSVDHLYLDHEAVPTLVEVKRSNDTRARREVVAQMLDYAANAVAYGPVRGIQALFAARCADEGLEADEEIRRCVGEECDPDAFWQQAEVNLKAGRIRMVFVVEKLSPELRGIIEFLGKQMTPASVVAVEITRYASDDEAVVTFVPRVFGGRPERADLVAQQWDEELFIAGLEKDWPACVPAFRAILEWSEEKMPAIRWGEGGKSGSFMPRLPAERGWHKAIVIYTYGRVEVQFKAMLGQPPFDSPVLRREFAERLGSISGGEITIEDIGRRPSFPLKSLSDPVKLKKFIEALDWFVEKVTAT